MSRDPLLQPFAVNSIWNTPIGSNAIYRDANIEAALHATADIDHFYILNENDPLKPLYAIGSWSTGRSTGTFYQNIMLPLPDDLVIPDASGIHTPNRAAAFLMPDGRTLVQMNALTRDRNGGFVYGWRSPDEDLYGPGITGGHAGSGLSSIGGTIRRGELTGTDPIRHALKVNLHGARYLSYTQGLDGGLGYRWPAVRSDAMAPTSYNGTTPGLMMGSLLALPPDVTAASLGIETEAGRKLFDAFQNYGGYVVDDTGWNAHAIALEDGVLQEFQQHYGYTFESTEGAFYRDYMRIFSTLHIVDNNTAGAIGGGGTPRVPLAEDFTSENGNAILGTGGDDNLNGTAGKDTISGKRGNDVIAGFESSDYLKGNRGNDQIQGGPGNDFLFGNNGNDTLWGQQDVDYLDGGWGEDVIDAGVGNDYLSGWSGNDWLDGGGDFDTVVESPDVYTNTDTTFILQDNLLIGNGTDTLVNIEQVILTGDDGNNLMDAVAFTVGITTLKGGKGNDTLRGGAGSDTLVGGSGDDILNGRGSSFGTNAIDNLTGGDGRDLFKLGNQTRHFYGDADPTASGWSDYALIKDFNPTRDLLQLHGTPVQYFLAASPIPDVSGTAVFFDSNGNGTLDATDELVAIVNSLSPFNLDQHAVYV